MTAQAERMIRAVETEKRSTGANVSIQNLSKTFETRAGTSVQALTKLDIEIEQGSFVACVGPSGCGKSTLLSLLAGLNAPTTGEIRVDGTVIKKAHPKVGMVFQNDLLLEWRPVIDNVLLPIEIKKLGRQNYLKRGLELLAQVGLEEAANQHPSELSGGMRQRVAICRALIQEPGLLLMDEPFAALDALTREQMIRDLQKMWLRLGNTVVFITHGIDEAVFLADRVLVMSPSPGRVDLDLEVDLKRPRDWASAHEDTAFHRYLRQIRGIFEAQGILKSGSDS